MVKRLELESEVQEMLSYFDNGQNVLLSGGAGSGKTYSLVQVIRQVINENPTSKIACMTYTNAAVKEITERVNHGNLFVSTIHDFLWSNIKHFQREIKSSLIELMSEDELIIKKPADFELCNSCFDTLENGVQYKEYLDIKKGIISHDEVLNLSNFLFENYPKLGDILKDKYKFIFIDEYQDTNKQVVDIFLKHLYKSNKYNIIAFFGDSMQSIYDEGIGDLNEFVGKNVLEVKKVQNRRNPSSIINLANIIRTDGIVQIPSEDTNAPNMVDGAVKEGEIKFYYSYNQNVEAAMNITGWDFSNSKETKVLNLTHNLIAPRAGFEELMRIYNSDKIIDFKNRIKKYIRENSIAVDFSNYTFGEVLECLQKDKTGAELRKVKPTRGMQEFIETNSELYTFALGQNYATFSRIYLDKEQLIDDKKQDSEEEGKAGSQRDHLIKHVFKIAENLDMYNKGLYNEFIRATDYKVHSIDDKIRLKNQVEELKNTSDKTIGDVIDLADHYGICKKDDRFYRFITEKEYVFNQVKKVKFSVFMNLYNSTFPVKKQPEKLEIVTIY